jgi:hypothetical protein
MKNKTPFRERLWQFMQGRNGVDALYNFLIISSVILLFVGFFLQGIPRLIVNAAEIALIVWALFRYLSKNLYKRRKENADFLRLTNKLTAFFRLQRDRVRDRKTHVYRRCPKCKNVLRLPKKAGKHNVCCPCCSHRFGVYITGFAKKKDK